MTKIDKDDLAFPVDQFNGGLTKREYFASRLVGEIDMESLSSPDYERISKRAVKLADALIEALNESR